MSQSEATPRVLVVDDTPANIQTLYHLLRDDYRVMAAVSGGKALEIARGAVVPDIILLDIVMPGMDGFETCRQIKADPALTEIPVIFISALDELADKLKAFQMGAVDYITKPFHADEVRARVSTHLTLYRIRRELREHEEHLRRSLAELQAANAQLKAMASQLVQSEKMACIGQLAAGVAHEINNPISYIGANLNTLDNYLTKFLQLIELYESQEDQMAPAARTLVASRRQEMDLPFLREDARHLVAETREGLHRVTTIVQDLKGFSRLREEHWEREDLHAGLDSTLNIVWNELKYKAQVVKQYGELPLVECVLAQINQVLMNLLINASQAIETRGTITIRTGMNGPDWVFIQIVDTGSGISPDHIDRLFEPFFTTKPVGQGTGLGLSLAYNIVAKHHGRIEVASEPGKGSTFTLHLPVSQPAREAGERQEGSTRISA